MEMKPANFKWIMIFWITAGHLLVQTTGLIHYEFDPGIYWLPEYAFQENFFQNIFHLHTNPPLLNFIAGICYKIHLPFYIFCLASFMIMQIAGTFMFYNLLRKLKIGHAALFAFLLLGNPLHFIWFSFYYYPAVLFFLSIACLQILYSDKSVVNKFNLIALLFVVLSLLRASYHPLWILLLLMSFRKLIPFNKMIPGLLLLLIPLLWYSKNYVQYGFWSGSSLFGQNISAHYPDHLRKEINNFNSRGRYKLPFEYEGMYDENSELIKKFTGNKLLNDPATLHNVRTIPISKNYEKETRENWELKYSFLTIAYGTFSYFGSPAIDEYNNKSENAFFWNNSFLFDWFDLPNIKIKSSLGGYSFIRLSLYTLLYPVTIILMLSKYKSLTFEIKFILHWILITGFIYCTIDPNEAARMRYETEPLFYFLMVLVLSNFITPKIKH
ncbi:MAG: hypothetical protein ACO1G9_00980 [Bacteroidota bacterium]